MQHYDINIPVNGVREINVQGDYVYYLSGSAGGVDSAITLRNVSGSDTVILRPGQAFRLGVGSENVRWIVGNYANQGEIVGVLLMGQGEFSDNRISGSVEVIDGGRARTLANMAFYAGGGPGVLSANWPHVQLWNPAGSGRNLVISSVTGTGSLASSLSIRSGTLAGPIATAKNFGSSKKIGGANSVARIYVQNSTSPLSIAPNYIAKSYPAGSQAEINFAEPIVVPSGMGLITIGDLNTDFNAFFEYVEELI